jgi:hypothetical protein
MNHGAGLGQARKNTMQLVREQLKRIEARGYVPDDVRQLVLL